MTALNYDQMTEHLLAEGLSTRTVATYLATLHRAEELAGARGWDLLELSALEARALSDSWPPGRSSRAHLRSALIRAWDAAGRHDGPARALRVPRKPEGRCRALSERDAAVLAAAARARGDRKGLAVLLGLYGALRRAEIAGTRWEHLSADGWLYVLGKGDREGTIPLHPVVLEAWRAEERRRRNSPWVFPGRWTDHATPTTVWTWVHEVADTCGLVVSTHELRHTALATAHDATGDLRSTMAFARHKRPETTALYTRTTSGRLLACVRSIDYRGGEPA